MLLNLWKIWIWSLTKIRTMIKYMSEMINTEKQRIYITGDLHGDQVLWESKIDAFLKPGDIIIVAGDFGIGFLDGRYWPEEMFYDHISQKDYTVLFIDGNHEDFNKLNSYEVSVWNGGRVHLIRHNLIHLMRGEVYKLNDITLFAFGGGYSLDKYRRIENVSWWPQEMPSYEEYENALTNLEKCDNKVDYIITHTASINSLEYISRVATHIKSKAYEEYQLNSFLQDIEDTVKYDKWYFGHFHVDMDIWKNQYAMFDQIRDLRTGESVFMRR